MTSLTEHPTVKRFREQNDLVTGRHEKAAVRLDAEWQSLSYGANYKSAYCMAVCPAGEDVIAPFLTDRAEYLKDVVRPLQQKEETVYVIPESDAEQHVAQRFPNKHIKRVGNGLNQLRSISAF